MQQARKISKSKEIGKAEPFDKNPNVSDTDKMIFDKRFKNFLNHKQEYLEKARKNGGNKPAKKGTAKRNLELGDAEYFNE